MARDLSQGGLMVQIREVRAGYMNIKLKQPFTIALGTVSEARNVVVEIETDQGHRGWGEAAPMTLVTGDFQEGILQAVLGYLRPLLLGQDPRQIARISATMDRVLQGNYGARVAVEIALFDLLGKIYGMPLYVLWGGHDNTFESDYTIGMDEPQIMASRVEPLLEQGYRILKVKVGENGQKDLKRVAAVAEAASGRASLRLDANQGWTVKEAIATIKAMEKYNLELVEEPIPRGNLDGLALIRQRVNIPIMADETVFSPRDALEVIKRGAADLINIKLMKAGGLLAARKIDALAATAGMECMVGCMIESRLSITAAAHLVASSPNITRADLDAPGFLVSDPVSGGAEFKGGVCTLPERPGLGLELDRQAVEFFDQPHSR